MMYLVKHGRAIHNETKIVYCNTYLCYAYIVGCEPTFLFWQVKEQRWWWYLYTARSLISEINPAHKYLDPNQRTQALCVSLSGLYLLFIYRHSLHPCTPALMLHRVL